MILNCGHLLDKNHRQIAASITNIYQRMVDPHQILIDNGNNSSKISDTPNLPANSIQMNESDRSKHQNRILQQSSQVNSVCEVNTVYENRQNEYGILDDCDEIMCGPLSNNCTNSTIQSNDNDSENVNAFIISQNGNSSSLTSDNFVRDIVPINVNTNKVCIILNNKQTKESNDSQSQQTLPSTSINSADTETQNYSAEFQSYTNFPLDNSIDATVPILLSSLSAKMDSRKVEPLRININRDPIKTKIKLGPPGDRQTMSPKSSSSSTAGIDECDDASEIPHENQHSYPKITIKPIVKPPTEIENHHNHSAASYMPSSSQEAIPKLKIKKIDSINSNSSLTPLSTHSAASNSDDIIGNYQTHLLSESSPSVPK